MSHHALSPLFDPRSLIVVSTEPLPLMDSLPSGLRAHTVEVRADRDGIFALPEDLVQPKTRPDLAILALRKGDVPRALDALAPARPQAVAVLNHLPSREDAEYCRRWAADNDCIVLGPHSFGLQRPHAGLNASPHPLLGRAGRVALVTQSRSIMAVVLDWADDNLTAFSTVVSLGAEAMLDVPRVLDFLVADSRTDSIALYLDDVRNAREFMSAIRAAASVKPVVVLKAGHVPRTRTSVRPLAAPEAGPAPGDVSIAPDTVFGAAVRRAGAVRVQSFVQLFSAVKALGFAKRPGGGRIAVYSNGSGTAQLALDRLGTTLPTRAELSSATHEALAAVLGPCAWTDNPVVDFAAPDPAACAQAVRLLIEDPGVDGVLAILSPDPDADMHSVAQALAELAPSARKPLITCFMGDAAMRPLRRLLDGVGSPSFRTPEGAVDAFGNLATYHYNQQLLLQTPPPEPPGRVPDQAGARFVLAHARDDARLTLTETEAKAVLSAFHIPVVPVQLSRTPAEAVIAAQQIGFPVAIKIDSPDVVRKSAVRGVHLDIRNSTELVTAYHRMLANARAAAPQARLEGITVEAMAIPPGAIKASIGVARDPLFGPVIRFGPARSRSDAPGNPSVELPPLNGFLARRLMERSPLWRHGLAVQASPRALDALEDILVRISEIVCALPDIDTMDINPVVIDGDRVLACDTRITLTEQAQGEAGDPGPAGYAHMAIHPYPARLLKAMQFADGAPYTIRPIRPEDATPLQDFTRGLSEHTRYMRFISVLRELSPRTLARYTQVDYHRELAMVATVLEADPREAGALHETIIGVARYLLNPDGDSAEYSLVIGDAWQRRGLGMQLMTALIDAARAQGLHVLEGVVLANNRPMRALMQRLGFNSDPDVDEPSMRRVWLEL